MEVQKRMDQASEGQPGTQTDENILESIKLLTTFPEEVWLEVLKKLFHPEDLRNLKESSMLFEKLFQNFKTKVLFAPVIKIIFTKYDFKPTVMKAFMLHCRLVCRTWDLGVNSVLNNIVNYDSLFDCVLFNCISGSTIPFTKIDTDLTFLYQPWKFLRHFDETYRAGNRYPFICSSVSIDIGHSSGLANSEYISWLLSIFTKYGHNVLRLCARLYIRATGEYLPDRPSNVWHIKQLRDLIQLMPNLKVLELCCVLRDVSEVDVVEDLKLNMQSFIFPQLKMLKHLHLERVPSPVCDALLRSYSHVSMLSIWPNPFYPGIKSSKAMYTVHMPNLTSIYIYLESNEELARLKCSKTEWPLKSLFVNVGTPRINWQELFNILIDRWADTLTELRIDINPSPDSRTMLLLPTLKLPNLKMLIFDTIRLVSLDFILELKNSLQYLVVKSCFSERDVEPEPDFENEKVIKFYRFRRNLMDSNIWQLFPKLNKVEYFDCDVRKSLYYRKIPEA